MKVQILMGLPGSGKTTYAKQLKSTDSIGFQWVDLDTELRRNKERTIKNLSKLIEFGFYRYRDNVYILDGLIHTNERLDMIIGEVIKNEELTDIEVHYWRENRAQCLINDKYRRSLSSASSIKNLALDVPDLNQLKSLFNNISIKYHDVPQKPDWLIFADKHGLGCTIDEPYVKSDSWSTGGSHGNCWDDSIRYHDGEEPLKEFKEFDALITCVNEGISFVTYKELYASSVSIGTKHEKDYYGGRGSNYAYYQYDVEILYRKLLDKEIIKEEFSD